MPDGCLQRAGRQKTASGMTVYLMEELGDARLNCAQLSHYIDLARQIVEKSPQRDQIFESAGHLLQAIPEHLFKLEKSLQAVALAADRLDYEELKQDLKPEKVEELERVLKDVRIRHVPHRSEPRIPMNPMQAAEELQKIATETREKGIVPTDAILSLVASLEGQDRTASDVTGTADLLEEMGKALLKPVAGKSPSRVQLAATLRKVAADHLACGTEMACSPEMAGGGPEMEDSAEEAARRSRFEKNVPADPTQNMAPEDAKDWEQKNDENKDNFKEGKTALERNPADFAKFLERMVGGVEEAGKQMRHSLEVYRKDPGKNAPQLGNFFREVASLQGQMRVLERSMPKDIVFASERTASLSVQDLNQIEGALQDILTEAAALAKMDGASDKAKEIRDQAQKALKKLKHSSEGRKAADWKILPKTASKDKWKMAAGRTKHLEGKSGHTLCGETAHKDTIVKSMTDSNCHYCVQEWKRTHGGL